MNKKEAKEKLKEAKENLELELITQDDYDNLKTELKPIIMGEDSDKSGEELIPDKPQMDRKPMRLHPFHNTHWRIKKIASILVILIAICVFIFKPKNPNTDVIYNLLSTSNNESASSNTSTNSSSGYSSSQSTSKSKTITCKTCGITYEGSTLQYGKYCSQRCCVAYEGMSSECGDVWNDLN